MSSNEGAVRIVYLDQEANLFSTDGQFPNCFVRVDLYDEDRSKFEKKQKKSLTDRLKMAHSSWMTTEEVFNFINKFGKDKFGPLVFTCEGFVFNTFELNKGIKIKIDPKYIFFEKPIAIK